MYDLWATNGMCPPTLIQEITWLPIFELKRVQLTPQGKVQTHFRSRPGVTHTIEYMDSLGGTADWEEFANNGSVTATNTASLFEDDFTANTSGGPSATGARFYRFKFDGMP